MGRRCLFRLAEFEAWAGCLSGGAKVSDYVWRVLCAECVNGGRRQTFLWAIARASFGHTRACQDAGGRLMARSPLLDFLFRNGCIRTQKKVSFDHAYLPCVQCLCVCGLAADIRSKRCAQHSSSLPSGDILAFLRVCFPPRKALTNILLQVFYWYVLITILIFLIRADIKVLCTTRPPLLGRS